MVHLLAARLLRLKTTETLLGIETYLLGLIALLIYSLKTTETLLGIETVKSEAGLLTSKVSQNYWNPFRDWNKSTRNSTG